MTARTKNNLKTAMEREALDSAKYQRFAARARMDGDWDLAKTFQDTADSNRVEHISRELELDGSISDTAENLRSAINTEMAEMKMFSEFAQQAIEDGDQKAATLFLRISRDKSDRQLCYQRMMGELSVHSDVETVRAR
jgi:rubrerythrin